VLSCQQTNCTILALVSLHDVGTLVFQRYLTHLSGVLATAQTSELMAEQEWMQLRLAPDMFPLCTQAAIACNMALRAVYPLVGQPSPPYGEFADSFAGLGERSAYVQCKLAEARDLPAIDPATPITVDIWGASRTMPLSEHLTQLVLPNFFFHISMTYALMRHAGLAIGKGDFDGYAPRASGV
jgi:uncharacterized protein